MELTGLGKNAVYDALKVLKNEGLLRSEQKVDSKNKRFGQRVFRLTTRFIRIFVDAEDVEPLPESREPESREPESRETQQINEFEQINEVNDAPAPNFSTPLNTKKNLSIGAGAAPLSPGWNDFPKADTPDELKAELSRFYQARPEDWRMTKEATPAQNWTKAQTETVVSKFCDWAIGEGWEKRTFKQINARLKRWFKEEPLMQPKPHHAAQTIQEPRGAAYQPIPKDY